MGNTTMSQNQSKASTPKMNDITKEGAILNDSHEVYSPDNVVNCDMQRLLNNQEKTLRRK